MASLFGCPILSCFPPMESGTETLLQSRAAAPGQEGTSADSQCSGRLLSCQHPHLPWGDRRLMNAPWGPIGC